MAIVASEEYSRGLLKSAERYIPEKPWDPNCKSRISHLMISKNNWRSCYFMNVSVFVVLIMYWKLFRYKERHSTVIILLILLQTLLMDAVTIVPSLDIAFLKVIWSWLLHLCQVSIILYVITKMPRETYCKLAKEQQLLDVPVNAMMLWKHDIKQLHIPSCYGIRLAEVIVEPWWADFPGPRFNHADSS